MKRIESGILAVAMMLGAVSCSTQRTEPQDSKETMRQTLADIMAGGNTLLGHHDDPVYGHTWNGDSDRSDLLEVTGCYPAMMSWDLGGLELGDSVNLDGVEFQRIKQEVKKQHERGGYNTFSWHLYSPVDSTDCWNIGDSLTVKKILTDKKVNETFRLQLASLARFFNSLTDNDGNDIPVIFRPFHEHTGGWFWWGKPYNTPEEYIGLWRIMKEEFDREGVDNLLYAYSTDRISTREQYLEYYPGDDAVDILGIDIYLFNGEDGIEDFSNTVNTALPIVSNLAQERGKIAAFTETGSEGIPVTDWWTRILLPVLKNQPLAYVVLWRNAHDKPGHFYVPYPGHESVDDFVSFCNDSSIMLIKD